MLARKIISALLAFLIFLPPTQGWSQQSLQDQAQFYLQNIGPGPAPSTAPSPTTPQTPVRSDLPKQAPAATKPTPVPTAAPRQPEETSIVEQRASAQGMPLRQFETVAKRVILGVSYAG